MQIFSDNRVARRLVTREFVRGGKLRYSEDELKPHLVHADRNIDLRPLESSLRTILSTSKPRDPAIDVEVAKLLHTMLKLTRREAAQHSLWSYIAIVVLPELVRHRWDTEQTTTRDRFWRSGTRPDSNYFGRLWWIAELTSKAGSYALTDHIFSNQSLAKGLFVRNLSHHRPAIQACVKVLGCTGSATVEAALKGLQKRLSVYTLASLTETDVIQLLKTLPTLEADLAP